MKYPLWHIAIAKNIVVVVVLKNRYRVIVMNSKQCAWVKCVRKMWTILKRGRAAKYQGHTHIQQTRKQTLDAITECTHQHGRVNDTKRKEVFVSYMYVKNLL